MKKAKKTVEIPVQSDETLIRDIAEQKQLDASGTWTELGKDEKPNVAATCSLRCYIQSVIGRAKTKSEQALFSINQLAADEALYNYMMMLAMKGRVYASNMYQAVRIGDFILVYLYTIGEDDEKMGKIRHNMQVIEVAQFNPVKIQLEGVVATK